MPPICAIASCKSTPAVGGGIKFYAIPYDAPNIRDAMKKNLTAKRLELWTKAINQGPLTEDMVICSKHFIGGKSAMLLDQSNPDWVPSLNLETISEIKTETPLNLIEEEQDDNLITFKNLPVEAQEFLRDEKKIIVVRDPIKLKKGKINHRKCHVPECMSSTTNTPNFHYYAAPVDEEERNIWLKAMGLFGSKNVLSKRLNVCQLHFDLNTDINKSLPSRNKLLDGVIPHRNLPGKRSAFDKSPSTSVRYSYLLPDIPSFLKKRFSDAASQTDLPLIPQKQLKTIPTQTVLSMMGRMNTSQSSPTTNSTESALVEVELEEAELIDVDMNLLMKEYYNNS